MSSLDDVSENSLRFTRLSAIEATGRREQVRTVYLNSYYQDVIADGGVFRAADSFLERFDSYASNPDLDLIMVTHDGEPIGQSWGWPLRQKSRWWTGVVDAPVEDFTHETGERTFALSEIMVDRRFAGRGIARLLHDTLLYSRGESRATLLVSPSNSRAQAIYSHLGWIDSGATLQPSWEGAPTFKIMMLDLATLRLRIDHPELSVSAEGGDS